MMLLVAFAFISGIAIILGGMVASWRFARGSEAIVHSVASIVMGSGPIIAGFGVILKRHELVQLGNVHILVALVILMFARISIILKLRNESRD